MPNRPSSNFFATSSEARGFTRLASSLYTPRAVALSVKSCPPDKGFGADRSTALGELAIQYTGPQLAENADKLEYKRVRSASTDIDEVGIIDEKKKK